MSSRRSLKWRIQIWHGTILAVVISVFATALYVQQRWSRLQNIDDELSAAVEVLSETLNARGKAGADPGFNGLGVPDTFAPRRYRDPHEAPFYIVWGESMKGSAIADASPHAPSHSVPSMSVRARPGSFHRFRNIGSYREAYTSGPRDTVILVGRDVRADMEDLWSLLLLLVAIGLTVFGLGLLGGWFLAMKAVAPIATISEVASDISEIDLGDRIDGSQMDSEFEQLATTLNQTFGRLETAFAQQTQFTSDASHELRTPLSVIRMHQELALSKDRSAGEYREALETCHYSTVRMTSLLESLLSLSRLDANGLELRRTEFDLKQLAEEATGNVRVLADAKETSIAVRGEPTLVVADRDRIGQVLTNLLTNAVTYSSDSSTVIVTVNSTADKSCVTVADTGPGIPKEHLDRIFDRFYRAESDRSREVGGSGLGLSICRTIIERHGGWISVESEVGVGSQFSFQLPLSTASTEENQPTLQSWRIRI